jgi:hypothetical protein
MQGEKRWSALRTETWPLPTDHGRFVGLLSTGTSQRANAAHCCHPLPLGTRALVSTDAAEHGRIRHRQGYTAAMLVEESRMLQVSIFQTLQHNIHRVDFSLLLLDVMAIADEVDSQLAQAMTGYVAEAA